MADNDQIVTRNELLGLAEREAQRLTEENDHGASTIMRMLIMYIRLNKGGGK